MDIQAEKLHLIEQLTRVQDINVIRRIKHILNDDWEAVLGYRPNGEPITKHQLVTNLEEAEKRMQAGRYTTQEDLEQEAESW
jgi:hypothetical protein